MSSIFSKSRAYISSHGGTFAAVLFLSNVDFHFQIYVDN